MGQLIYPVGGRGLGQMLDAGSGPLTQQQVLQTLVVSYGWTLDFLALINESEATYTSDLALNVDSPDIWHSFFSSPVDVG